ncbi:MAG: GNAT family N-acetyltransferase [Defluviitaleaceae bacterium]|nr:GNAT family N-acetyltransferase [Defluviitaleaceae bacterium]
MTISIDPVKAEEKFVFIQLMNLYDYDFTEFTDNDINPYGYYDNLYIDHLWTEDSRHGFFIRVDGKLAGFAIVRRNSDGNFSFVDDKTAHHINQFFVMKKYRRKGVGQFAAKAMFDKFRGQWEVCQMGNNTPARKFWKGVIAEYTQNKYAEHSNEAGDWVGFTFNNT